MADFSIAKPVARFGGFLRPDSSGTRAFGAGPRRRIAVRMIWLLAISSALAAPPGWALAPFGVGVYVHGHPGRGAAYTATQAAGFGAAIAASVLAGPAADDGDLSGVATYGTIAAGGAALGIASWFASALDASRLHELEAAETAARVRAWDAARWSADPGALRGAGPPPQAPSGGPS